MSTESRILSINGGSSSIKFAIYDWGKSLHRLLKGRIDRIGFANSEFKVHGSTDADNVTQSVKVPDQAAAVDLLLDWIEQRLGRDSSATVGSLAAVGHRIVHGGPKFSRPERITPQMLEQLQQLSPFDPEHLPAELMLIEAIGKRFPDLPQIACFDTAFHHDMPRVAQLLPIPRRYHWQGVRRYGFHGLSYQFLMQELKRLGDPTATTGRVILAHLGNGTSLAAVRDGKCIDTSMSFTPTAGVPMGTRSGDLDPSLAWYLARTEAMSAKEFNQMVNSQSGLLGVSETSSDMRDLLKIESQDVRAAEAIALFCYEVKKRIGAYATALGGIDTLVFSGGIGENGSSVRQRICMGMEFLGIKIAADRNAENAALISLGPTAVRVIATDEEKMIAGSVCQVLEVPGSEFN